MLLLLGLGLAQEQQEADLDGDGVPEILTRWESRGSGGTFRECVRRGSDGAEACLESEWSARTRFSATHTTGDAEVAALLESDCTDPEPTSPAQGALWLLSESDGVAATAHWHSGRPVQQIPVCMAPAVARAVWAEVPEGAWRVYWHPAGVDFAAPLTIRRTAPSWPKVALQTARWEVWYQGHGVAIYDRQQDRHAWVANVERHGIAGYSDKVDRWPVLSAVRITDGSLVLTLVGEADPGLTLSIPIAQLAMPRAP